MTTSPTDGRGAWRKFICLACGYIYDEELGDPEDGLPAGTRFEDIPDDWQCPLCGVRKATLNPMKRQATSLLRLFLIAPSVAWSLLVQVLQVGRW